MPDWLYEVIEIAIALLLVVLNGFFVAAEFALVKVRPSRVDQLVVEGRAFAGTAQWLSNRMEATLSACQLGITMASLALGWVGEPAFASLLEPLFQELGITSAVALHTTSFIVAFTAITALHLVIGEQAPKIFAIRRPEDMLLWCALPLRVFYLFSYPLMAGLNWTTMIVLRLVGLTSDQVHEVPHTEEEIRLLIREAHERGSLTGSEHRLINAVFEFDDMICRRVMVPRADVDFFDIHAPVSECLDLARQTKHTRYPVCDGSLDDVLGVVHVKDLVGVEIDEDFNWASIMRPPRKVPDELPISKLLRHFQATHQLLALVVDEYGTVIGIVTLENVLEQIIGAVDDEFDEQQPNVVTHGPDQFLIQGSTPIEELERKFGISRGDAEADTFSGLLAHRAQRLPMAGDEFKFGDYVAEVLEVRDDRAVRVRLSRQQQGS